MRRRQAPWCSFIRRASWLLLLQLAIPLSLYSSTRTRFQVLSQPHFGNASGQRCGHRTRGRLAIDQPLSLALGHERECHPGPSTEKVVLSDSYFAKLDGAGDTPRQPTTDNRQPPLVKRRSNRDASERRNPRYLVPHPGRC